MKAQMILIFVFVFVYTFSYGQTTKVERTTSAQVMKFTQFHDNGEIAQHGHIHRNKLDGVWESFNVQGNKIAVGNYDNGGKAGTWFFWTDEQLIEVEFTNNKVQDVIYWNTSKRTAFR
jgi:antitoxin component YwqK of YwqJK toxin-antitoxin module